MGRARTQFVFRRRASQQHGTWPFYFILSLISGQRELPAGSAGDAFPATSQVPRGVRRAPGGRGYPRRRPRSPTRLESRGTSTGPQLPLAASGCPPQGERSRSAVLLRPPPRPARSGAHTVPPQKSPAKAKRVGGTAAPGDGTGLGRRHTRGVRNKSCTEAKHEWCNGIVAPVQLRGLPNFFQ